MSSFAWRSAALATATSHVSTIDANNGNQIETLIPATGAMLFFDTLAFPSDATHPSNALLFRELHHAPRSSHTLKARHADSWANQNN
ncbi:hypothetical protein ACFS07_31210 [Undibacterium arcticum]